MLALLSTSRRRACLFGCVLGAALADAGCQSKTPSNEEGKNGGSGNSGTGAGAAGTPAATGGFSSGGTSNGGSTSGGASTGGSAQGGTAGSTSGNAGASSGGANASGGANPSGGASGAAGTSSGGAAGTGGGSAGASGTAGTSGNPCATAIFCDDFEAAPANGSPATPWTVQRGGTGTAAVDSMHHMSGAQSVKFVVPGQNDSAYIALRNAPVFPVTGNAFYGRVMVWLMAAPTASVHWTIIEGSGLVPGQTYHSAYRLGGQQPVMNGSTFVGNQLMANYETPDSYGGNGPGSDCWHHASRVVVPVGRWSCFEWQYDGPNNALTQWVDGTEVLTVRGMGNTSNGDGCVNQPNTFPWTAPTFDTLRVGWDSYQADTARTLWLDDFALSATRVGCPSGMGQ